MDAVMIVQFRSRDLEIDDACQARAKAEGCDPIEQRLWEAGFSREAAKAAADSIAPDANIVDTPS